MLTVPILFFLGWMATNHFPPWVSWHSELPFFIAALILFLKRLSRVRKNQSCIQLPRAALILVLSLLGLALLQWGGGQLSWHARPTLVFLYLMLALIGISFGWSEARDSRSNAERGRILGCPGEWLAWTILLGAAASLVVAAVQVFQLREAAPWMVTMPSPRRPGGNLAQPNHLATLLVMAIACVCYLKSLSRIGWTVVVAIILLMLVGVAMTESRTGLLATLCVGAWLGLAPVARRNRSALWFGAAVALGAIVVFAVWPHFYRAIMGDTALAPEGIERLLTSGRDPRVLVWSQLLAASALKPWLGWGFLSTAEAHHSVAHLDSVSLPLTYGHNLVLDLALWLGWPLGLLFAGCGLYWLISRARAVQSAIGWFGYGLLLPLVVHSLLEFPFAYAYLLLPAMLGLGYTEGAHRFRTSTAHIPKRVALAGMLAFGILGAWSTIDYLRIEEDFRSLRFHTLGIGNLEVAPRPRLVLLDNLSDLIDSSQFVLSPRLSDRQMRLIRDAALHNPWPVTYFRYATALALSGDTDEAMRQMRILRAQFGDKAASALTEQLNETLSKHQLPPLPE